MWQSYFTPPADRRSDVQRRHDAPGRRATRSRARTTRRSHGRRARSTPSAGTAAARTARPTATSGSRRRCITFPVKMRCHRAARHARGPARFDSRRRDRMRASNDAARANQHRAALARRRSPTIRAARRVARRQSLLHRLLPRGHPAMGQQDRAFVADGVFAYLRRRRSLEALARDDATRGSSRSPSSCASSGTACASSQPSLNAADALWLRAFKSRLATPLAPAVAADLPDWLWERLGDAYGDDERAALARAWLAAAPLDLRINPLKTTRDDARAALAASGIDADADAVFAARPARRGPAVARAASAARRRRARGAGRRQPARRLPRRAAAHRHGRRFLRRRRRQDAAARRADALAGPALRVRRRTSKRLANLKPRLARSGLSNVHPQLLAQRARHEGQAPRRQDRPRAGRRAVHRLRHAAPQSRSQVAAAGIRGRRARAQAARDPRRRRDAREARRPARLRDVQRAARGERGDRRRVSRRASGVRARRRRGRARARRHRARHRARR